MPTIEPTPAGPLFDAIEGIAQAVASAAVGALLVAGAVGLILVLLHAVGVKRSR